MKKLYVRKKSVGFKQLSVLLVLCLVGCLFFSAPISTVADYNPAVTKRALVMGAAGDEPWISGDCSIMYSVFQGKGINTNEYINTPATTLDFLDEISDVLGDADRNDISYVFITSHGAANGNLGINGDGQPQLSMTVLKQRLNTIGGPIIVMINSCYSGQAIHQRGENGDADEDVMTPEKMMAAFLGEDMPDNRSGDFYGTSKFTVFCACEYYESSNSNGTRSYGTEAWARGLGWCPSNETPPSGMPADANGDSIVTALELQTFAYDYIYELSLELLYSFPFQTPCYYSKYYFRSVIYTNYPNGWPLGDVDQNDSITTADALWVQQYLAGLEIMDTTQMKLADVDGDGYVTTSDMVLIYNFANNT